ncbi:iron-siderophore ABC transporter substrate-binding protein [Corynebacterium halotolerans]|nr:iron-siderophore ABC transporter substrate-binding protein [Corynebacterium halotolerans]
MRTLRKMAVGTGAVGAAALLLTGCTSSVDTTSTGEQAAGATVSTKFGDVTVPEDAERVVALGWGDAETALALGVQPVGASDWLDFGGNGVGPWAEGLYDRPPEIIGTLEPDYERIAALQPDLILDVKSSGDQERYERLSQIAPTVGVPEGGDSYLTPLDAQVEMIATALGKEDEGEQLLDDLDAQFEQARNAHPEFEGSSVAVASFTSEGWGAYVEGSERVQFMQQLGFEQSEDVAALTAQGFTAPVSQEQLDVLDADLLVVFPIYLPASEVTEQAEFQRLPAVEGGHAIVFDEGDPEEQAISQAYSLNSVLSIPYALEKMVPLAAEKVRQ